MKMTIVRTYTFESSHRLPLVPDGHKCGRMHGHSYTVRVGVSGPITEAGWVMDFADIDSVVKPLVGRLDHQCLNDFLPNPTSEAIAVLFLDAVSFSSWIEVSETARSCVRVER